MAEFSSHIPGTFCWPELATTDQKAGVAFYRALLGWDLNEQPIGPSEMYSMFLLRGLRVLSAVCPISCIRREHFDPEAVRESRSPPCGCRRFE